MALCLPGHFNSVGDDINDMLLHSFAGALPRAVPGTEGIRCSAVGGFSPCCSGHVHAVLHSNPPQRTLGGLIRRIIEQFYDIYWLIIVSS